MRGSESPGTHVAPEGPLSESQPAIPHPDDQPESLAGGRYVIEEKLGHGATATVWRVTDSLLGVQRAVKLLSARAASSAPLRRRLLAEARTMAQLDHPNILRVYDIGQEGDRDYVVMALAERGSLADWVDAHGPMPPDMALAHLVQALSALHAAHLRGIVHRDIKPQNLLIGEDGRGLLADFGIALLAEDRLRATRTGVAMGSLAFMAPEQRLDARSVTSAADLYAAGTTLYNLLTAANPVDLFAADADSTRWVGIPSSIAAGIRRAVSYAPADRFSDARSMARHLRALMDDATSVPLSPPPDAPRLPGWEETERPRITVPPRDLRTPQDVLDSAITFLAESEEPAVDAGSDLPELPGAAAVSVTAALLPTAMVEPPLPPPTDAPHRQPSPPQPSAPPVAEAPVQAEAAVQAQSPADTPAQPRPQRQRSAWLPWAGAGLVLAALLAVFGLGQPDRPDPQPDPGIADPPVEEQAQPRAADQPPQEQAQPRAADQPPEELPAEPEQTTASGSSAEQTTPPPATSPGSAVEAPSQAAASAASPAAASPAAASPAADSGPAGTWTGNVHANSARLVLSGSGRELRGSLTSTGATTGLSVEVEVSATLSEDGRQLVVRELDLDAPQAGSYRLQLSGDRLEGHFSANDGSRSFPVVLTRVTP